MTDKNFEALDAECKKTLATNVAGLVDREVTAQLAHLLDLAIKYKKTSTGAALESERAKRDLPLGNSGGYVNDGHFEAFLNSIDALLAATQEAHYSASDHPDKKTRTHYANMRDCLLQEARDKVADMYEHYFGDRFDRIMLGDDTPI